MSNKQDKQQMKIKYADLFGLREEKYDFLNNHGVDNTDWQEFELKEPNYFFVPKDYKEEKKYYNFISVKDIFGKYNAGIATGKDDVLVSFTKDELINKLRFSDFETFRIAMQNYGISEKLIKRWYEELNKKDVEEQILEYNYRPFDRRFVIYNPKVLQRARRDISDHLIKENLALTTPKNSIQEEFNEVIIVNSITDKHLIGAQTFIFPLYLYNQKQDISKPNLFLHQIGSTKVHNYNDKFIEKINIAFAGKPINYESILYYIYAILYSVRYRKKYNEFLKIDFPKIPFTKDKDLFDKIANMGKELVDLHLLKSSKLEKSIAKFPKTNSNQVEFRKYYPIKATRGYWIERVRAGIDKVELGYSGGIILINNQQFFSNVSEKVWNYYIGGYQVLDKWLKDRIGKTLQPEDVNHYLKIITTIHHTILIQKEIDEIYPEVEKNLIRL